MSLGLPISKEEIDLRAGEVARQFQRTFKDVEILQSYLTSTPDQDLINLGYTAGEVASLKTAASDMSQLRTIWIGTANLPASKDFTTFVRRLWGVGAF